MPITFTALINGPGWHNGSGSLTYSFPTATPDYYVVAGGAIQFGFGLPSLPVSTNTTMTAQERTLATFAIEEWNGMANINLTPHGATSSFMTAARQNSLWDVVSSGDESVEDVSMASSHCGGCGCSCGARDNYDGVVVTARQVNELGDAAGNTSTTARMNVGDTFVGNLSTLGDRDWVGINLVAGETYTIALTGITLDDPYLRVYGPSGNLVAQNDDNGSLNSSLTYTATSTGRFYVGAGAFADNYTGTYEIAVMSGGGGGGGAGGSNNVGDIAFFSTTFTSEPGLYGFVADFPAGGTPGTPSDHGDVWINTSNSEQAVNQAGHTSGHTYIHEIGHALGLRHPNEDPNNTGGQSNNNNQWTVMSYIAHPNATGNSNAQAWPITPMMLDIQAVQQLYGANFDTRSGTTAYFGDGADLLGSASAERAYQYGGANMTLNGRSVIMTIWDGGGHDVIDASDTDTAARIDLRNGEFSSIGGMTNNIGISIAVTQGGAVANLIEDAIGTRFADTITGNAGANQLMGGAGNDTMTGGAGNDSLIGGAANDSLTGGTGTDTALYTVNRATATVTEGTGGRIIVTSSEGTDTLLEIEQISFADGTFTTAQLLSTLIGDAGNNLLTGTSAGETLQGLEGNDTLRGLGGDDTLIGGAGADRLEGGAGFDTASYAGSTRSVRVDLQNEVFMFGDAVGDTFDSIEAFQMGDTIDQLRGDAGDNIFYGGGSVDRLYGRAGDDVLDGQAQVDALYGGAGVDTMTGGEGTARDRFIYFNIVESGVGAGNRDVITDFVSGQDRIEISRFDADLTRGFNQAFDFVGNAAFSNTAGELRYFSGNGRTVVQADNNGDGVADFEIELTGEMSLIATDFLL